MTQRGGSRPGLSRRADRLGPGTVGLGLGLLASVLWGTVFVAGRYLVDVRGLEPMFVGALRFNIGAAVAVGYLMACGRSGALRRAAGEWPLLALLGAIGIFGMGTGVFMAVRYTSSVNASIICNANPIFIALFAPLVGERVPAVRLLGLLLGVAGCAAVSLGGSGGLSPGENDLVGCAFAVLAATSWAAYTVLGKGVANRRGGLETAAIALVAGGLLYVPVVVAQGSARALTGGELLMALYIGVGPSAIAMLAWYKALEYVDANVLGPTQYIATAVSTLLGWLLLGESIGPLFIVGGSAIIAGLWLATRANGRNMLPPGHER